MKDEEYDRDDKVFEDEDVLKGFDLLSEEQQVAAWDLGIDESDIEDYMDMIDEEVERQRRKLYPPGWFLH
jgi:hypothetical protein